jgi:hypothetical protein
MNSSKGKRQVDILKILQGLAAIAAIGHHGSAVRDLWRPTQPIDLKGGTQVQLIIENEWDPSIAQNLTAVLVTMAALPLEEDSSQFSGREHDTVLYPTAKR